MTLIGYAPIDVTPWETAGGGKAVACAGPAACIASFTFTGATGRSTMRVRYFDQNNGRSRFVLRVGSRVVDQWTADDTLPTKEPNGHSSTWRVVDDVALTTGDTIVIEGTPDGDEHAPLDYVEFAPAVLRY
jgi:alpha-glucuronidase